MERNKDRITKRFLFINREIDITCVMLMGMRVLKLKCDICGKSLNFSNIGFVSHPHEDHLKAVMRCKGCHNKIKEKKRQRNSSYMIIDD